MESLRILDIDPLGAVATDLLRQAAAEIRPLYGQSGHGPMPLNAPLGPNERYVAAVLQDRAVGCAGLRQSGPDTGEIVRMFVAPQARRLHIASSLLKHLISEAQTLGFRRLVLETGDRQPSAIGLYEKFGFKAVAPFGLHANDPTSRCFELDIAPLIGNSNAPKTEE